MMNCKSGVSPIIKGENFSLNQCPKNDLESAQMKDIPYSSAVGNLMYAMTCTRPDISFAIGMLGRYVSNPGIDHWVAAKKVMRYLKGTREYMLTYRASDQLEVIRYSDSNYAGCLDSRKSTPGYIFLLAGGVIYWKSKKQTCVSTSTMEAEFVAFFEATSMAIWLRNFISGLRVVDTISKSLRMYCNNVAALYYCKNDKHSSRAKHIGIKYNFVKELVQKQEVSITHIKTSLMIVNPMTKALAPKHFTDLIMDMGLCKVDVMVILC
ncbi:secreted RxLR effector protein 161-like [Macadamia integrifolia]|uniref:secreted RxLR effector protein 161-like n=1 Tax=Macadamia integrifolia TaxID=60698 RepID=UPI001C4FC788|nr:secreted RxLR effector protein 161-like [Macadamia integrifolia]